MNKRITLENIEQYSTPLDEHPFKWIFENVEKKIISAEHRDQIIALTPDASRFLWNLEIEFKIFSKKFFEGNYFKENETWSASEKSDEEIRKWLFNRRIPFANKVFVPIEPAVAFVMTWKMVIKNSDGLFLNDQTIWDRTLNWGLAYDHEEVFCFGKNRIYTAETEAERIAEHEKIIREAMEKIVENENNPTKKYSRNPFLK